LPASLQGCQICLGATYQNGGYYTKIPQNIPNDHKIYQNAVKFNNIFFFSALPYSKNYIVCFENTPSGNPASLAF
jgi:hypothetical protein